MVKFLKKLLAVTMVDYKYFKYFYTLTLVNGQEIECETCFYTTFKWSSYVDLDIYGKKSIEVKGELYNTKNILKVVLNRQEEVIRSYNESDWHRPSYIF